MRKNININLFGTIYSIDEDACQLLESYLDNMKAYFSRQNGGEEIADDIEHRVAELLWEKKSQGVEAIDIQTVKSILKQIGNPEQISGEAGSADSDAADSADQKSSAETASDGQEEQKEPKEQTASEPRKFYRDTTNKMLGGVLSGLAQCFGGKDVTPWRIGYLGLLVFSVMFPTSQLRFFFNGASFNILFWLLIFGYLICWMVVPEADTPEKRLQMKGIKVTPEAVSETVMEEETRRAEGSGSTQQNGGCANGCLSIFVVFAKILAFVIGGFVIFILLMVLLAILASLCSVSFLSGSSLFSEVLPDFGSWGVAGGVAIILIVAIPIYGLIRLLFAKTSQNRWINLALFAVWLFSVVSLVPIAGKMGEHTNLPGLIHRLNTAHGSKSLSFIFGGNSRSVSSDTQILPDGSEMTVIHTKEVCGDITTERFDTIITWPDSIPNFTEESEEIDENE